MEVNLHRIVKYNNFVAINSERGFKKKVNRVLWFSTCRKKKREKIRERKSLWKIYIRMRFAYVQ